MRISVFIKSTTFHKGFGGLETQNKVLCEGLVSRGHEVVVFSPSRELTETQKESGGVVYKFVPSAYRMLFSSVDPNNWYNRSYREFLKLHQQKPFDTMISQSSAGIGIIARKEGLKIRITGISHGTIGGEMRTLLNSAKGPVDIFKSSKSLIFGMVNFLGRQRRYIHGCDNVVAVSTAVKESIINETYAPAEKITVIHNGIEGNKILKKNWDEDKNGKPFEILYIGRIEESKGLGELLSAVKGLEGVYVNIVGDGPYLEELRSLCRLYKMSQKILFYGKLPYDKVTEMYSCNDVFVLPTKRVEGFPMTLVEACFAGIPVITTNMGGNSDAVENNHNGLLLDKTGVETLQEALSKLINDRELSKRMGLNGRMKAEKEFTLEHMLDSYEKII